MTGFTRYGFYRYGYSEYRPEDRPRPVREIDRGPTAEELFGTGVALRSENDDEGVPWDFMADNTGDLAATRGGDELRKDLAFATARDAYSLLGTLASANDMRRLEDDIERIARRDSRVTDAGAEVMRSRDRPSGIDAAVEITAETETLPRMVFPVQS